MIHHPFWGTSYFRKPPFPSISHVPLQEAPPANDLQGGRVSQITWPDRKDGVSIRYPSSVNPWQNPPTEGLGLMSRYVAITSPNSMLGIFHLQHGCFGDGFTKSPNFLGHLPTPVNGGFELGKSVNEMMFCCHGWFLQGISLDFAPVFLTMVVRVHKPTYDRTKTWV